MSRTLPRMLEEAARRFPDRDAVVHEGGAITYRRLDELGNRLANALKRAGVRRGDRVGIYLNKSIEAVAALIAVLKADAVCVPLDPTGPVQRIAYIIGNCQVSCLITQAGKRRMLCELLPRTPSVGHVVLAGEGEVPGDLAEAAGRGRLTRWDAVLEESASPPARSSIDADLAYVLYTSGSTGHPKGVMISHHNVLSFVDWAVEHFALVPEDRVSSHAPLHFDLSLFDLFATMRAGGAVCLVPPEIAFLAADLGRFIAEERITVWQSVPSVLVMLANQAGLARWDFGTLRLVLFAGEVFPERFLRELMGKVPHPRYCNIYGATEINDVTCHDVAEVPSGSPLPIGRPCSNVEVFALDEEGRVVTEPGTVGELYVRGGTVAQGYWGDPAMTAERFVQNPLHSLYRDPVYRTGDLVDLDADGNYRYLGRRDSLVKIRGYRVSIGEVEEALLRFDAVEEAAVVALRDDKEANFLKAFVVAKAPDGLALDALKRHCLLELPKYMVPEAFEIRDALPKTSTGKVDKQTLRRMEAAPGQDPAGSGPAGGTA